MGVGRLTSLAEDAVCTPKGNRHRGFPHSVSVHAAGQQTRDQNRVRPSAIGARWGRGLRPCGF